MRPTKHPFLRAACVAIATAPLLSAPVNAHGGGGGGSHGSLGSAPRSFVRNPSLPSPRFSQMRSGGGRSSGGSTRPTGPSTSSGGAVSTGPPASPIAPNTTNPMSQIGTPAPQPQSIAPLSPQLQTQFSSGGSTGASNLALSPGSGSPSETAPSAPGGGGKSLSDCMGFWERETHMTKTEWRAACKRTLQEYPSIR